MVVLAPHGASGTYGQLSDTGADTIRAPRVGFTRVSFTVLPTCLSSVTSCPDGFGALRIAGGHSE